MPRSLVSLLCIVSLLGCSSQSTLSSAYDARLPSARQYADGTVHLVDEHGDTVYLRADDKLVVSMADGQVVTMRGGQVCRTPDGLLMRTSSGDPCTEATWIGAWGDVSSVSVEQFDGAATVAITATVAVVVAGIILVAIASKGSGNSSGGGRTLASPGRGGGSSGGGGHVTPGPIVGGGSVGGSSAPHHHGGSRGGSSGGGMVLNIGVGNNTVVPGTYASGEASPMGAPVGNGPSPLFSGESVRRAVVRPALRFDFTGCISSFQCTAESVRLGALLADLVELSGGIRIEQRGSQSALLALAGIGLQGRFPTVPSMALYLGSQFAFGPLVRVAPQVGLRFRPAGDLWIGINPLAMTYFADEHKAAYTPSLDLAYEF